jgi:hypothetical protein
LIRSDYYNSKADAVCAFNAELARWGLQLDPYDLADFIGDTGRKTIEVCTIGNYPIDWVVKGDAVISWYRMPSGRYEFTGYLA